MAFKFQRTVPLLLLAACAPSTSQPVTETPAPAIQPSAALDGTGWILADLPEVPLTGQNDLTLRFEQGRASGSDGCNRFMGQYAATASTVKINAGAGTQMACPPEVMSQAVAYRNALANAQGFRIEGNTLTLLDGSGQVTARFRSQPVSLAGTSWRVTAINNQRGGVVSVVQGSDVSMTFADGTVTGNASCNRYNGPVEQSGDRIRFGALASTRRACTDEALNQQEKSFFAALATAATARFEGTQLELRTADNALAISAVRADTE